jgi:hypothetical protein
MSIVDDFGRYDGRPKILKAALYPLRLEQIRDADLATWIRATEEAGLVRVYAVDGKEYLQIEKFDQRMRAKKSKWPPPDAVTRTHPRADAVTRTHRRTSATESEAETKSESESKSEAESATSDPVELPHGFPREFGPKVIALVHSAQQVGTPPIPADFIEDQWRLAKSRGGCDTKRPIADFANHCIVHWRWTQSRQRAANGSPATASRSTAAERAFAGEVRTGITLKARKLDA